MNTCGSSGKKKKVVSDSKLNRAIIYIFLFNVNHEYHSTTEAPKYVLLIEIKVQILPLPKYVLVVS